MIEELFQIQQVLFYLRSYGHTSSHKSSAGQLKSFAYAEKYIPLASVEIINNQLNLIKASIKHGIKLRV
jgi:hypothetical protein